MIGRGGAALGCVLGLAYLTKSAMFPLSAVFLALAGIVSGRTTGAWRRTAVAAAMFAIVAVPYAGVLSANKHRLTFGDTGKLAYVWVPNTGGPAIAPSSSPPSAFTRRPWSTRRRGSGRTPGSARTRASARGR